MWVQEKIAKMAGMGEHFGKKDALGHVLEKRAEGASALGEIHGAEIPTTMASGIDAARDTAALFLFISVFLLLLKTPLQISLWVLLSLSVGWLAWKATRSSWLAWSRLERLHRLIEQEKFEIEHHRPQEREELIALYGAKGFEGKLLNEIVDVLMADQDRLLKVMLEEEMGLSLQAFDHPLEYALGAAIGVVSAALPLFAAFYFFPHYGIPIVSSLIFIASGIVSSVMEGNRVIAAAIWNFSMGVLGPILAYFVFQALK